MKQRVYKMEDRFNATLIRATEMTNFMESEFAKTAAHSIAIEKVSKGFKTLKTMVKETL